MLCRTGTFVFKPEILNFDHDVREIEQQFGTFQQGSVSQHATLLYKP